MTRIKLITAMVLGLAPAVAGLAMAQQDRPYRLNDAQLGELAKRLETHADLFRSSVKRAIDRSAINGTTTEGQVDRAVQSFDEAIDTLRDRIDDRQSVRADAESVLGRAASIETLMTRNQFDQSAQRDWQVLRLDVDELARAYGIDRNWNTRAQNAPYRTDDKQISQLLKQMDQKAQRFEKSLDRAFDRGSDRDRQGRDEMRRSVQDFRDTANRLRDRVGDRQSSTNDVEELLRRGESIDGYMQQMALSSETQKDWRGLRSDLDTLARAYNMPWDWNRPGYTQLEPTAGYRNRLTGTYQLENGQGDSPRRAAEQAVRSVPSAERPATFERLLARLEAPELIAIEREGGRITMASTSGPRVTFDADGRDHAEEWTSGQTMHTRATLVGERLTVGTTGNRNDDYTATFEATQDGRGLRVTRTVDSEAIRQPVTVRSVYRRVSDQARWDLDTNNWGKPRNNTGSAREYVAVPYGIELTATLDTNLSTETTRVEDPFTMTVRTPSQYQGALVQGIVSGVSESGRLSGNAGMTLDLRSIRFRDGRSYRFDGVVNGVRTPDGNTLRVGGTGDIDDGDSQTRTTVERGAIGAALGAVIGAIAGGTKGAAIGAVIGAGAGAGSVIVGGRERLELPRGTEVTFTSGAPPSQLTDLFVPR
jgi:hypothetical protein